MKISEKLLVAAGVFGLVAVMADVARAGVPYISGSATIVLMNGASNSVGAEAGGVGFDLPVVVTPTYGGATTDLSDNTVIINQLQLSGVALTTSSVPSSFTAAAALKLVGATTISDRVSIIRAGAGVDGLD